MQNYNKVKAKVVHDSAHLTCTNEHDNWYELLCAFFFFFFLANFLWKGFKKKKEKKNYLSE